MAGRPSVRTEENSALIVGAVKDGLPYRLACQVAGISEDTFKRWRDDDADFAEAIKKAETKAAREACAHITKNEAWQARAWYLERRFPEEFGLPQAIERALIKLGFVAPGSSAPGGADSGDERPEEGPTPAASDEEP